VRRRRDFSRYVVLNDLMKRFSPVVLAVVAALAAIVPAGAGATVLEIGATTTPLASPTCPPNVSKANCTIILTETTALQTASDGLAYPTTITRPGRIVAFTLGLAKLSKTDIAGLDSSYGGTSQVAITVLRPGKSRFFTVTAEQSPAIHVQPWFGHVVQFPLSTTLPVKAGDVVALTVPTWAPVLTINLPRRQFQYRASRASGCASFNIQTAQLTIGSMAQYRCFYVATRVEYTATEVTTPPVPKS
jgi:hypothetical protein